MTSYAYKVTKEKLESPYLEASPTWCEGYLSALANHKLISESEFDKLMELVHPDWQPKAEIINASIAEINKLLPLRFRVFRAVKKIFYIIKN